MRMRTVAILAAAGLGVAALAVVIVVLTPSRGRQSGLEAALAEWQALGGKTTLAELRPSAIPDEHNAAIAYAPAFDALAALSEQEIETLAESVDVAELRTIAVKHNETIRLLEQAAARPDCLWDSEFYTLGINAVLPPLKHIKTACRLMDAHARVAHAEGDEATVVRSVVTMLNLTRHCGAERLLVSQMVSIGCAARTLDAIHNFFQDGPVDLANIEEALAQHEWNRHMIRALLDEGTQGLAAFDDPKFAQANGVTMLGWNIERDKDYFLREMIRHVRQAEMPYWQARPEIADRMPPRWALLSRVLLGAYDKAMQSAAVIEARRELALAAIALRRHRAAHGSYPDTFAMPIDPFTGKPLHYQREGDGFVIWSESTMPGTDGERIEWRWN